MRFSPELRLAKEEPIRTRHFPRGQPICDFGWRNVSGADLIIVDDPLNANELHSETPGSESSTGMAAHTRLAPFNNNKRASLWSCSACMRMI